MRCNIIMVQVGSCADPLNGAKNIVRGKMWLLGFEPRSLRPQRRILTTKLQPL